MRAMCAEAERVGVNSEQVNRKILDDDYLM